MTKAEILDRLMVIANVGAGARGSVLDADLIDQENFFDLQQKMTELLVDLSNEVRGGPAKLVAKWPHVFKTT